MSDILFILSVAVLKCDNNNKLCKITIILICKFYTVVYLTYFCIFLQRPIVEFSLENKLALLAKEKRMERMKVGAFLYIHMHRKQVKPIFC